MTKATEKAGMQSREAVLRISVSCDSGRRARATTYAAARTNRNVATATTGSRPTRVSRLPRARRSASASATAANTKPLASRSSGMTTASTNPGSDPSARNALGGQSVPQLLYGAGTGYCSTSSALGRKNTPTVIAAARTRSLSARLLSRPDG